MSGATIARNGPPPSAQPAAHSRGRAYVNDGRSTSPRLALSVAEACECLGVGWDFWREHVAPEVRIVRRGRRKLVPVRELEAWLEANADRVLEEPA